MTYLGRGTIIVLDTTLSGVSSRQVADILTTFDSDDVRHCVMVDLLSKCDRNLVSDYILRLVWSFQKDSSRLTCLKYLVGVVDSVASAHITHLIDRFDFDSSKIRSLNLLLEKVPEVLRDDHQRKAALLMMSSKIPMMVLSERDLVCKEIQSDDIRLYLGEYA